MENIDLSVYIKPELLMLVIPIYLIGMAIKKASILKDKYIPIILGGVSFFFCLIHLLGTTPLLSKSIILNVVLEALVQGILIAACDVYGNQVIKQLIKKEKRFYMSFERLTVEQLIKKLNKYKYSQLHIHHTWKPTHRSFTGQNHETLQQGMKDYHINTNKWHDIGQHVTLFPDGVYLTGRDFSKTPASIAGWNTGAFAVEMIGNFDSPGNGAANDLGYDKLEGNQREAILKLAKYFGEKYGYDCIKFHRDNKASGKTCPGTSIDKSVFIAEAQAFGDKGQPEYKITEASITAMVDYGVINSPEYWRNVSMKYLNDLLANVAQDGVLHERIYNGITDIDTALDTLVSAGVMNSPNYWKNAVEEGDIPHLKGLIINIADKCRIILEKIVQAEAGGEDERGKILVANVIFNRMKDNRFPHTLRDVVFEPMQFEPTRNGVYDRAVPSAETRIAVSKALCGEDYSKGAKFFRTIEGASSDSWHEQTLTRLFDWGNHRFYL